MTDIAMTDSAIRANRRRAKKVIKVTENLPAVQAQPKSLLQVIADIAADPGVNTEKMKAVVEIQRETEGRAAFNGAYLEMKPSLPAIRRDGKIQLRGGGTIRFIPYERLNEIAEPILLKYGFSIWHQSQEKGDGWVVHTTIEHRNGYSRTSTAPAITNIPPGAAMNAQQAFGMGTSYAKRYNLMLLLNIQSEAPEHRDTDAVASEVKLITAKTAKEFSDQIAEAGLTEDVVCKKFSIPSIDKLPAHQTPELKQAIAAYKKRTQAAQQ